MSVTRHPTALYHMVVSSVGLTPTVFFPCEAEQLIERQIRRDIQYRLILRQNAGEELPLPTGPTSPPQDARECIRKRHDNCHHPDLVLIIA